VTITRTVFTLFYEPFAKKHRIEFRLDSLDGPGDLNDMRIISGKYKGHRLVSFQAGHIRPTLIE